MLDRRVGAWLLTLPGPIAAEDEGQALTKAHRAFDGGVPREAFENTVRGWGYGVRPVHDRLFEIAPI